MIQPLFLPYSDLEAKIDSACDVDHWPYKESCILYHDSEGFIEIVTRENKSYLLKNILHAEEETIDIITF